MSGSEITSAEGSPHVKSMASYVRLKQMTSRAIVGNAGIGKSLFLKYVLIERLLDALPTAIQRICLTTIIFPILVSDTSNITKPTWALVDSNAEVVIPCHGFVENTQVLIIQATSPKLARYKEWTKHAGALLYYMNTWTWEETAFYGSKLRKLDIN
ncbi:hypothetical protein SeLEV6574_g08093 [Synchytrium endobioticum]|uniref:Uncharacterized protein n=1 Tax=Synchytrium endobioticum TaxID=286115 RepID=A0A507CEU0_9FUNG|nr:hypothetical protein SeLEV6574_g08093 [Synchytrium endobioticum]